jgi:hypothetical protein
MAIMSLDPTGKGQARWTSRWKTALNALDITFDGRLSAARSPRRRYRTIGERIAATGPSFRTGMRTDTFWTARPVDVHRCGGSSSRRSCGRGREGDGDGARRGEQASDQVHDHSFPHGDVTPTPEALTPR